MMPLPSHYGLPGEPHLVAILLLGTTLLLMGLFALRKVPGRLLIAWALPVFVVLSIFGQVTLTSCAIIVLGAAAAALVRSPPDWAIGRFSLTTFDNKSADGRALEIEWLGVKLLIALGRVPRP